MDLSSVLMNGFFRDEFGESVAIDGDTIVIGNGVIGNGEASYVFQRAGSDNFWTQVQKLDARGLAVAISGEVIISERSAFGRLPHGVWEQQRGMLVTASEPFGSLVTAAAISGDTTALGSPSTDNLKGSIGVFVRLTVDGTPLPSSGPTVPPTDPPMDPPATDLPPTAPPMTGPPTTGPPSTDGSGPTELSASDGASCTGNVERCGSYSYSQSVCNSISGCSYLVGYSYEGIYQTTGCYGDANQCSDFGNDKEGCRNQAGCLWSSDSGSSSNGGKLNKLMLSILGLIMICHC